ncbi:unnamed protein product [Ilex paraguariensis]|uniref:Uncharacterized protein n=1 Tax=Ilex paraguariensis TaxID=185542 RepID=A0ABC8TH81_9AQUA
MSSSYTNISLFIASPPSKTQHIPFSRLSLLRLHHQTQRISLSTLSSFVVGSIPPNPTHLLLSSFVSCYCVSTVNPTYLPLCALLSRHCVSALKPNTNSAM